MKVISRVNAKNADPLIRFTVADVRGIGPMMIACNDKGLVWLGLTDKTDKLQRFFPHAVLMHDKSLAPIAREIASVWEGKSKDLSVPLVLTGTEFQVAVWKALLKIKSGTTLTYGDIARQIGYPDAIRAVGTAVGKNPLTLLVPCHRVLAKAKGAQLKYGWGPAAKEKLLRAEGVL